jgi:hypothetical protein
MILTVHSSQCKHQAPSDTGVGQGRDCLTLRRLSRVRLCGHGEDVMWELQIFFPGGQKRKGTPDINGHDFALKNGKVCRRRPWAAEGGT